MHEIKPLFSEQGMQALGAALRNQPLLAFDFDGTLAPLVERPEDASVPEPLARRLARLGQLRPLAIVTGRGVADVTRRLGFPVAYIVGNHGAEERGAPSVLDPELFQPVRHHLRAAAVLLLAAGVRVEDKQYSLALHYRQAPDPVRTQSLIDELLVGLPVAFSVVPGRMVRNIVLADAPDKGDAVAALMRRANCSLAVFVGDDINDEAVFTKAPADWLTVRVANDYPQSNAGYFLDDYTDVALLLDRMISALEIK
jgi:trehalose 6-phosphate phosphatase